MDPLDSFFGNSVRSSTATSRRRVWRAALVPLAVCVCAVSACGYQARRGSTRTYSVGPDQAEHLRILKTGVLVTLRSGHAVYTAVVILRNRSTLAALGVRVSVTVELGATRHTLRLPEQAIPPRGDAACTAYLASVTRTARPRITVDVAAPPAPVFQSGMRRQGLITDIHVRRQANMCTLSGDWLIGRDSSASRERAVLLAFRGENIVGAWIRALPRVAPDQ